MVSSKWIVQRGKGVKEKVNSDYLEDLQEGEFLMSVISKRKRDEYFFRAIVSKQNENFFFN